MGEGRGERRKLELGKKKPRGYNPVVKTNPFFTFLILRLRMEEKVKGIGKRLKRCLTYYWAACKVPIWCNCWIDILVLLTWTYQQRRETRLVFVRILFLVPDSAHNCKFYFLLFFCWWGLWGKKIKKVEIFNRSLIDFIFLPGVSYGKNTRKRWKFLKNFDKSNKRRQ